MDYVESCDFTEMYTNIKHQSILSNEMYVVHYSSYGEDKILENAAT